MAFPIENKLVVAVSSSALFDLSESDKVYNERGLAKVAIGLARGRKAYDKREYIKENDAKREMDKAMKSHRG